jgi:hypothetical protein
MALIIKTKDPRDSTGRFAFALWHAFHEFGKFDKRRKAWVILNGNKADAVKAIAKFPALKLVPTK